ncbi:hypothetical protein GLOTRDRAFT_23281, partial [Gloeophyllum trabeum ATCC 11539]
GSVLSGLAGKIVDKIRKAVTGRFATGQSDSWKNIARRSVVLSMINVEFIPYLLHTYDISAVVKNAENLLGIVVTEIAYCSEVLGVDIVAWCTDCGGEALKMRRLLRERFPWIVTVECWAHQINLIVGDYFKLNVPYVKVMDKAIEVVKWFNNHSRALGLLKEEQARSLMGKVLSLILPVITRWTSHYLSCSRLLELEKPMRRLVVDSFEVLRLCAGNKPDLVRKAEEVLSTIASPSFWQDLRVVQRHLEPFAIAANVTQANNARLDVVLMTLANLYRVFSDPTEREVFLLALVLNPYVRTRCFNRRNPLVTPGSLWQMVQRQFHRMFGEDPDAEFEITFTEYIKNIGEFSDAAMDLDGKKKRAAKMKSDVNLVALWRQFDTDVKNGRNGLVKLAMRILSIVPNSAATERSFSDFGAVQTKQRNRLGIEKARQSVLVKV